MNAFTQTANVHYDPALSIQELLRSHDSKPIAWPISEKSTKFYDFTSLNSVAYSQNDTEVFELVQKATKHILNPKVLNQLPGSNDLNPVKQSRKNVIPCP